MHPSHVTARRVVLAVTIVVTAMVSIASSRTHVSSDVTNAFYVLFQVELLIAPLGALIALLLFPAHRNRAPGIIGAGLYVLVVGAAIQIIFPIWLPSDDTVLGSAVLGSLLATLGTGLALAGATTLAERSGTAVFAFGCGGAALALLLFTIGGTVWPLAILQVPAILAIVVVSYVLRLARRALLQLKIPGVLACVGIVLSVSLLLIRGPGDWASAADTIRLFSFPIVVMGCAVALGIIDLSPTVEILPVR